MCVIIYLYYIGDINMENIRETIDNIVMANSLDDYRSGRILLNDLVRCIMRETNEEISFQESWDLMNKSLDKMRLL